MRRVSELVTACPARAGIVRGEKGSARGRAELIRHPVFSELMTELEQRFGLRDPADGSSSVSTEGAQVSARRRCRSARWGVRERRKRDGERRLVLAEEIVT